MPGAKEKQANKKNSSEGEQEEVDQKKVLKLKKALKTSIAPKKSALTKPKKVAKNAIPVEKVVKAPKKALGKATKDPKKVEASEKRPRVDIESSHAQVLLRSWVSGPRWGSTALKWADREGQAKLREKGNK
jgi:hypothetical protein